MQSPILAPIVALVAWSLVMQAWLYATRIPAMRAARVPLDPNRAPGELTATLPPQVRWKADNYNHLMEQPTIFYAAVFVLALSGYGRLDTLLAWIYVVLRIAHSLWQAAINRQPVRALLFLASSVVLGILAVRALLVTL